MTQVTPPLSYPPCVFVGNYCVFLCLHRSLPLHVLEFVSTYERCLSIRIVPNEMILSNGLFFSMLILQALPEDKKPLSAELFWLTFRLHAGLPLSPRDSHAGVDSSLGESDTIRQLFEGGDTQRRGNREMALLMLCSFAEGRFTRPKSKKSRVCHTSSFFFLRCFSVVVVGDWLVLSMYAAFQGQTLFHLFCSRDVFIPPVSAKERAQLRAQS